MYVKWNLVSIRLKIVFVSVQDRCMVCAKHTIGTKIILTHTMALQGNVGQVEAHFGSFGDSVYLGAR
jgi:hypothetical protein